MTAPCTTTCLIESQVNHSVSEYVRGKAHTNGVESFWSMLKRGYQGTYHKMSAKHLGRYVNEFSGRHNVRMADTLDQMKAAYSGCSESGCAIRISSRATACSRALGRGMSGACNTAGTVRWRVR